MLLETAHVLSSEKSILEKGVDFVGIINEQGRLEDFIGSKEIPLSRCKQEMFCMELALQNRMQKDFDDELSTTTSTIIERGESKFVVIPTKTSKILLGIMKKEVDHTHFVSKMTSYLKSLESCCKNSVKTK